MSPQDKDRGEFALPYSFLSIDLGEMTGSAWYIPRTSKLTCGSTPNPRELLRFVRLAEPDVLLLERFPVNRSLTQGIENVYEGLALTALLISPGTWKPFMKSRKRKFEQVKSQHEKDALDMLRYYLITTFGEDLP